VLGDLHRQRLDVDLALHLREDAALLGPGRLADELDVHGRLNRLVEADFVQVDVRDVTSQRVLLEVLEDRGMRRLLALEDDIEDRVQAGRAGEHPSQLPLGDADRVGLLPVPVQDAGDEPFAAQPPRVGGASRLALAHFQLDPFAGHTGGEV